VNWQDHLLIKVLLKPISDGRCKQIQALYEYDKTILNAYLDVANLMSKVKNIDQYYKLKSEETQALEKSIDIANQLFKNSRADYLEVLLNQRDAWMPKWNWWKLNRNS
jgi:outer membrane protein TolC